ncbi:MAG: parvulin peptidyl-prolyl isomerase [Bacteroidetes bacterium]|nr:MAG: parvulin peptidyl-prolyl isomerase [Bacteroidota bacterium]
MKKIFLFNILLLILLICHSGISLAQPKEGETLEKIVAVVGNDVITMTDVTNAMFMFIQSNPKMDVPDDQKQRVFDSLMNDSDLKKKVLDALINEKLVVAKAVEDSITVTDDEVEQRWEYQLQQYIGQFGSEKRIEDVFGMSLSQIRNEAREIIKKKILAEKMQQTKLMNVKVTPREVEEFYSKYKDSLQNIPEQVELYHIVKFVNASNKAKEDVYQLAKNVRDSIVAGGDFAAFAKKYSNDLATASNGGELGWFPKGKLIREFEKAAFDLQPGQISLPVETPFGFHIIQAIDKKKDSILTRHILFKVGGTSDDIENTKNFLKGIKDSLATGMNFEDIAKKYSDETETKGFGGFIAKTSVQKLPPDIRTVVEKLTDGSISEPMSYITEKSKSAFQIIYRKRTIPSHFPTLENDRKDIEEMALNFKKLNQYDSWIEELRSKLYWEIKE